MYETDAVKFQLVKARRERLEQSWLSVDCFDASSSLGDIRDGFERGFYEGWNAYAEAEARHRAIEESRQTETA